MGSMGLFIPISPQNEGYHPPERWSEFRVQMWKRIWQYQGLRHLQMTSDSQDPLISFAPLSSQIPVFGVYCNTTVACEAQSQNGLDCTQLTYYSTKKFSMIQQINTNATIAVNSDVDCNLNLPVQKPLFTASSILKLYSGIEVWNAELKFNKINWFCRYVGALWMWLSLYNTNKVVLSL